LAEQNQSIGVLDQFASMRELLAQKHVETLETVMKALRSCINSFTRISKQLDELAAEDLKYYQGLVHSFDLEDLTARTATHPSVAEYVEWSQFIADSYRKELNIKASIIEEIDYNDLNNITDLQEMWAKDMCVDKAKIKEFLQLAQGFIEEHSVVLL
jgi:ABC-type nitrate/sulfonate/bicarbonate transport system substrate-binding protein